MPENKPRRPASGIRFKTWQYFVAFSFIILIILIIFQVALFEPFYRSVKMRDIKNIVTELAANIDDPDKLSEITVDNDGCFLIANSEGNVHAVDAIGVSCLLYQENRVNTTYLNELKESESGELSLLVSVTDKAMEMLIYGKQFVNSDDEAYFVLFNTPLQPLQSTISIFRRQYLYISLIVLSISALISLYFSERLSRPIVSIKKEAQKMSEGNYADVNFQSRSSFREIDDLTDTLTQTSHELAKIDELRTDLIANVSHDIRTPLTMIKAYAEMIRDITGDSKVKREENLEIILQEADYMNKLINDMSEMTRMQSGQVKLTITDFPLNGVIDSTADKFKTIMMTEGVEIIQNVEPELLAHADKLRITEVIYNFLGNAVKHYGPDKKIYINAFHTSEDKIRVEVVDHGPGIEPEVLSHIWERYYKTDKQYRRAHKGSGLGLAISKAILERHNAEFGVTSKVGSGSTFYFEIESAKQV